MAQTIDLGKVTPVKGVDYWTPSEEAEMTAAKKAAIDAAAAAQTARIQTEEATEEAKAAAEAAQTAAASVDASKKAALDAATHATNAATNADAAAADANREMERFTQQEQTRQSHESTREAQEQTRQSHESTRETQEQTRQRQEQYRAEEFSRAQTERQSAFAQSEAQRQQTFDSKEAQRDAAVEEATKVSQKVIRTQQTLGPYAPRTSKSLVIDKDNMAIDAATGKPVAKTGWAISKPILIERGNEYLFKLGTTDGNVWCAAKQTVVPAWDEEVNDPETGEVIDIIHHPEEVYYAKKVQLNAGAELPEDGYLRVLGMPSDFNLVVSFHKATAQTEVIVLRDGLTANICTQVGEVDTAAEENLTANMSNVSAEMGRYGTIVDTQEYRIGQYPMVLLGSGVPSASVRPVNLGNDNVTGLPLPWDGTPEFVGQQYIDLEASAGGLYYAKPSIDAYGNITSLTWANANA